MSFVDSSSAEQTQRLGQWLGAELKGGDVIGLAGELGSGKTCLVQGIARGLGVDPGLPVTSPTFTLVGEYPGRVRLRHADFYRVESYARLEDAGFDDLLDSDAVETPYLFDQGTDDRISVPPFEFDKHREARLPLDKCCDMAVV